MQPQKQKRRQNAAWLQLLQKHSDPRLKRKQLMQHPATRKLEQEIAERPHRNAATIAVLRETPTIAVLRETQRSEDIYGRSLELLGNNRICASSRTLGAPFPEWRFPSSHRSASRAHLFPFYKSKVSRSLGMLAKVHIQNYEEPGQS